SFPTRRSSDLLTGLHRSKICTGMTIADRADMASTVVAIVMVAAAALSASAQAATSAIAPASAASQARHPAPLDHSGKTRKGKASYYSHHLSGRKMADGGVMDPNADIAASKTLPLGTTARVTNLRNGLSTEVTVRDRGPYVKGRIVDLSPHAARAIGIGKSGVTTVTVAPIAVPQPDGSIKP